MILKDDVKKILEYFKTHKCDVYIVGGFVRNFLMGKASSDLDLCTASNLEDIKNVLKHLDIEYQETEYENLSFTYASFSCELTRFRIEGDYKDHRHPSSIVFTNSLEEDLKRRDFTINALCYHLDKGILDYYKGREDLYNGILRTIGDPYKRFDEDALRLMRLMRFVSQYQFKVEDNTLKAYKEKLYLLNELSWSAKAKEFLKLLCGDYVLEVDDTLWRSLFKELDEAYYFDQHNPYHAYSLYEHSLRVVSLLPKDINLRLAGLFHDLGKLYTQVIDEKGIGHYPFHTDKSLEIAKNYTQKLGLSKKDIQTVLKLITYHDIKLQADKAYMHRLLFDHGLAFCEPLFLLKKADNKAKSSMAEKTLKILDDCEAILKDILDEGGIQSISDLKLSAYDMMEYGLYGEKIKEIQDYFVEKIIQGNLENNRDELLKELRSRGIY